MTPRKTIRPEQVSRRLTSGRTARQRSLAASRRSFLKTGALAAPGAAVSPLLAQSERVVLPVPRLIYNNDGNDHPKSPVTEQSFLDARSTGLQDSQVDCLSYCTGVFDLYTHRSDLTQPLFAAADAGPGSDAAQKAWVNELRDQGHDTLELMTRFARENGRRCFWSMRMNDTHDSGMLTSRPWLRNEWKLTHRDWLMHPEPTQSRFGWINGPSWTWSAVNYEHEEVRHRVWAIIDDVVGRCDLDGIELDFTRFPVLFSPQMRGEPVTADHAALVTELLRRIRKRCDEEAAKRGRPFGLSVMVPNSVGYCQAIGIDLPTWCREDLVDWVIGGGDFLLQPWKDFVEEVKTPFGTPVIASLSASRLPMGPTVWRGEALEAWEAGVSGIATFNLFRPDHLLLRELADPVRLAGLPHRDRYTLEKTHLRVIPSLKTFVKGGERFLSDEVRRRWTNPPEELS